MVRLVVVGGSNSVLSEGWVGLLREALPDLPIVNLSIGAATSPMAYYRLVTFGALRPYDVVIWEYALNDQKQIEDRRITAEAALRYVELVLQHVAAAGARFLAVVMTPADLQPAQDFSLYRVGLDALLSRYGVQVVDVNGLWRSLHKVERVPNSEYRGLRQYRDRAAILSLLTDRLRHHLARPPGLRPPPAPCLHMTQRDVAIITRFDTPHHHDFANSLLQVRVHMPPAEPAPFLTPPPGM